MVFEFCFGFAGIVFFGKFHQHLQVVTAADQLLQRADGCLEFPEFVRLLPSAFRIAPEVVAGHFVIDFCDASGLGWQVKDSLEDERYASTDLYTQLEIPDP